MKDIMVREQTGISMLRGKTGRPDAFEPEVGRYVGIARRILADLGLTDVQASK